MEKPAKVQGIDVPIVNLTPLRERSVSPKSYAKLLANLRKVGLIEPLCICRDGSQYFILDGFIRWRALTELGVQVVPCIVLESKDLYTPNRQVNHLSPKQETKMLRKALEKLDERTIAEAFGIESLNSRLGMGMRRDLHQVVLKALESGRIQQQVAKELSNGLNKRQLEILELMKQANDWSVAFARAQVLRTPPALRGRRRHRSNPWSKLEESKQNMTNNLQEVEKHHDFYSGIYRKYAGDLLKLAIYVRQILTRPALCAYLAVNDPDALSMFESVVKESEGRAAV